MDHRLLVGVLHAEAHLLEQIDARGEAEVPGWLLRLRVCLVHSPKAGGQATPELEEA